MKKLFCIMIIIMLSLFVTKSQTLEENIMSGTCDCIQQYESLEEIETNMDTCMVDVIVDAFNSATSDELGKLNSEKELKNIIEYIDDQLIYNCYHFRKLVIERKIDKFYKFSANDDANENYRRGNIYMDNEDYSNAIKEFKKAIKKDKNFIYAYDHLAISYRKKEDFKKAIKYYEKSLEVFPEGDVALLNIAVAYTFIDEYHKALENYSLLIYFYNDNPEGYFGAGKILYLMSDYENALKNIFVAHRIYEETESEYITDSETIISIMYSDLKSQGLLDIFDKVAKEYDIEISIND